MGERGSEGFPLDVYVPQSLSRNGVVEPAESLLLTLCCGEVSDGGSGGVKEGVHDEDCGSSSSSGHHNTVVLRLAQAAKSKGGDKFEGSVLDLDDKLTVYLPQELSRVQVDNNSSEIRRNLLLTFDVFAWKGHSEGENESKSKSEEAMMESVSGLGSGEPRSVELKIVKDESEHVSRGAESDKVVGRGDFKLHAAAKSKGGDRYKGELTSLGNGNSFPLDIYVPQSISRDTENHLSIASMSLCLLDGDIKADNSIVLQLTKAAKGKGGDKYVGQVEDENVTVYLPQELSRGDSAVSRGCMTLIINRPNNSRGSKRKHEVIIGV